MASRGRGRRGRPRGPGQAPPAFDQPLVFDQQAFVEAVGIAATAIAQASITGSQGGTSKGLGLMNAGFMQGLDIYTDFVYKYYLGAVFMP